MSQRTVREGAITDRGIWAHPDGKHMLVQYANAILIFDPATGNSNTLSY